MSTPWDKGSHPDLPKLRGFDYARIIVRVTALAVLVFGGLIVLITLRLVERPFFGQSRPVTPHVTQLVCRNALRIVGLRFHVTGTPMRGRGAVVANHSSWLDIFALNAVKRVYFVSKSEVATWPGIGWLARATGTVFIERTPARARVQTELFQNRLLAGHKLLFFPEGTSTDGLQVLPFKTTLFEAFFTPSLRDRIAVQPVAVIYRAPAGIDPRFYGWWGSMAFGAHLLRVLAPAHGGAVELVYCTPLPVAAFPNRKSLAAACEAAVRDAHSATLGAPAA